MKKTAPIKRFPVQIPMKPKKQQLIRNIRTRLQRGKKRCAVLNYLLGTYYSYAADTDFILYDQAEAAVEEARIDYNRYLDQTDEIAAAEANVQALENTINQSRIIAPFDGTVTDISAVSGQRVSSGDTAVRIDNLDNLVVEVAVSEVDINKVSEGQKAVVTFDALPEKEYEGRSQLDLIRRQRRQRRGGIQRDSQSPQCRCGCQARFYFSGQHYHQQR